MKKTNLILPLMILLLVILGCGGDQTEKTTRGRIKYVITREHNESGGHGWGSWEVVNREFYINHEKWIPATFNPQRTKLECIASPTEAVEAFKCDELLVSKKMTAVLRMTGDAPEYIKVWESPNSYSGLVSFGAWLGDGKWLIFRDYFYNVETDEKREIKSLPAEPRDQFGAASPDMKTIVLLGTIWIKKDDPTVADVYKKAFEKKDEYFNNKLEILWLIDADTGEAKHIEVNREKYPRVFASSIFKDEREDKLKEFREKLV